MLEIEQAASTSPNSSQDARGPSMIQHPQTLMRMLKARAGFDIPELIDLIPTW
ncbi:hypothetical protein F511_21029 [Dorcoceras hygrometricum]|uniref:Uncharacterized protein n=1 Tax=Dorcoceras hygrometricum TaxID=472368 RepID=A0A2Z7AFI6_9LAMI|nr:hypothetical protein F511_21029 [Dorcoceras hygrometricum]